MTDVEDIYPLSPVQEGMLFHSLYAPGAGVYINQFVNRLEGDIRADAFEWAWEHVVNSHGILRSGFEWERAGRPLQLVRRSATLPMEQQDWRHMTEQAQSDELDRFLRDDRAKDFDLRKAPLMRLALIRLQDDSYQLIWTHHHLLLDGWSVPIIVREVMESYEARVHGRYARLKKRRPYRDYIEWLQQQDLNKAEEFWRNELKGLTAPTKLPSRRSRSSHEGNSYRQHNLNLSREELEQVSRTAKEQ